MSIPDSEAVWKTDQEELKRLFPPQLNEKDEEEIEIIVNTVDDKSLLQNSFALQHDYIVFSESSEDLSSSSLEKSDYSM